MSNIKGNKAQLHEREALARKAELSRDEAEAAYASTPIYQLGYMYAEIGNTLMDPSTTISKLYMLGKKYGLSINIELVPIPEDMRDA